MAFFVIANAFRRTLAARNSVCALALRHSARATNAPAIGTSTCVCPHVIVDTPLISGGADALAVGARLGRHVDVRDERRLRLGAGGVRRGARERAGHDRENPHWPGGGRVLVALFGRDAAQFSPTHTFPHFPPLALELEPRDQLHGWVGGMKTTKNYYYYYYHL